MKQRLAFLLGILMVPNALAAPQRIISLAPHATELAYAAGLGDKLIAASEYSDYPSPAKNLERVSNYQGIKLERIVALQPDLILVWPAGNPARELEKLEKLGFNLFYSETASLKDIAINLKRLSQYAEDPSVGQEAALTFTTRLRQLKQQYDTNEPVRYFYQLSEKPIITLAQGNWPSEVFEFCGGENIFADSKAPYPQVSQEQIIVRQPQAIFTSEHAIANGNLWQQWSAQLPAVEQQHIWSLTSDWLNRPTPRTLLAIEQVCNYFEQVRAKNK
ncbi:vitamin B12 ABC transporter substrate-binding protein BtuF [Vibrio hangzhouensis]|uniref:vitamin B12 ABC transporter substrate-binding protein BtuF n=1 Tax=Vibrio hangzhouensis TaxID=462991 RepID=UPI001C984A94|nr:vitamin B12 ABC transporter substrate-binding protein BtuF [Vibrio hangzhouensis]MBY6198655.1 vitamin B12 ABC transporter substrate-binding protein BtuF [Vibrio hangzhouensis]